MLADKHDEHDALHSSQVHVALFINGKVSLGHSSKHIFLGEYKKYPLPQFSTQLSSSKY